MHFFTPSAGGQSLLEQMMQQGVIEENPWVASVVLMKKDGTPYLFSELLVFLLSSLIGEYFSVLRQDTFPPHLPTLQ